MNFKSSFSNINFLVNFFDFSSIIIILQITFVYKSLQTITEGMNELKDNVNYELHCFLYHFTRIAESDDFKYVSPFVYILNEICPLWKKFSSSLFLSAIVLIDNSRNSSITQYTYYIYF